MRLFIAIDLDEKTRGSIAKVINELKSRDFDVKWVNPDNIHLTLKFLGEVREDQIKDLEERVSNVLKGMKRFKSSISELGYFGSPNYVKVIWLDVTEGREKMIELSRLFNKELSYIRKEYHESSPHITIGRVRTGRNREVLLREIERLKHVKIGELDVNEIKLKRSVLGSEGPVYSDLKVFNLG
jgi:2'-5' RNA ligase